jgi:hypothetical protein
VDGTLPIANARSFRVTVYAQTSRLLMSPLFEVVLFYRHWLQKATFFCGALAGYGEVHVFHARGERADMYRQYLQPVLQSQSSLAAIFSFFSPLFMFYRPKAVQRQTSTNHTRPAVQHAFARYRRGTGSSKCSTTAGRRADMYRQYLQPVLGRPNTS